MNADEPPPPEPLVPAGTRLEASILADPETLDNYIVYGDWLEAQGDPRGQLVAIGHELAKNPGHHAMLAAHAAHVRTHRDTILGSLRHCDDMLTGVEWHMGFIRRVRVAYTIDRFNNTTVRSERERITVADAVGWLLDDPGPGRFLQHLILGMILPDDNDYDQSIAVLARKPRALRSLLVGDFSRIECELNWTSLGDFTKLWPMVPELRELTLRGGSMTIGPIHLPKLETITTITGGLDAESFAHIAAADWPELRSCSLQVGRTGKSPARGLGPLLAGTRVPKLSQLGIVNCEFVDELLELLVDSPLLPRLYGLDVSMGTMSMDGAEILLANVDRFRHLHHIGLDANYVPEEAREQLEAVFPDLFFGAQRDDRGDPGNRFAAAIE